MNTPKIRAIIGASLAGSAGFWNWLVTLPPEQQSGIAATLVELTPIEWRPTVGVWTRAIMFFLGIYVAYQAAHSGPQTPPRNDATTGSTLPLIALLCGSMALSGCAASYESKSGSKWTLAADPDPKQLKFLIEHGF